MPEMGRGVCGVHYRCSCCYYAVSSKTIEENISPCSWATTAAEVHRGPKHRVTEKLIPFMLLPSESTQNQERGTGQGGLHTKMKMLYDPSLMDGMDGRTMFVVGILDPLRTKRTRHERPFFPPPNQARKVLYESKAHKTLVYCVMKIVRENQHE